MASLRFSLCLCFWTYLNELILGGNCRVRESDVIFILFNREIDGREISLDDSDADLTQLIKSELPTVFVTHGWTKTETHISVTDVRDGYLNTRNVNVIDVGWGNVSQNEYLIVSSRVPAVGRIMGQMLLKLLNAKLISIDATHLIGHSLGAHVVGIAGRFVITSGLGTLYRITGLDPAGPSYRLENDDEKLSPDDAHFVDVIHTCISLFGYAEPLGDADFYPNGGECSQPGCNLMSDIFCGHGRSWRYYVESLKYEHNFPAVKCDSERNYINKSCDNNTIVYMGVAAQPSDQGVFYLTTSSNSPYGRGNPEEP